MMYNYALFAPFFRKLCDKCIKKVYIIPKKGLHKSTSQR